MRAFVVVTLSFAVLSAIAACGVEPTHNHASNGAAPFKGTPRVRILVDERPHDATDAELELAEGEGARYGDPLHVVVDGIKPGTTVRVEAHAGAGDSFGAFETDDDGVIDLNRDAPSDGTWTDADGEGFMWSMANPPAGALDLSVTVRALVNGDEVATATISRRYINDGEVTEAINDGTRQGLLAIPDPARFGDGPYPAVLVFGGSEGGTGTGTFEAMYLASLGYAALGVGYFGAAGLPDNLVEVPLEILESDLALLAGDVRVDPDRIGVMGGSRGGELALLLGAHFPVVKAVVAQVPSGYVWGGLTLDPVSAWSFEGAPLAFVPASGTDATYVDDDNGTHVIEAPVFLADIAAADPTALEAATIRAEDIAGPVLFFGGSDDKLWASCDLMEVAWQRRQDAGVGQGDVKLCFEDAGHGIATPGWSTLDSYEFFDDAFNMWLVLGGTPAGNGQAGRAADTATRKFLEESL